MILYYATTSHLSFYQHYPRLSQCFFVSSDYYKGCHVSVMVWVQGVIIVIEFGWRACSKRYSTLLKCPPARSVPKRPSFSAVPAKKFSIAAGTISSSTGKKNTKVIAKLVSHPLTISSRKYSRWGRASMRILVTSNSRSVCWTLKCWWVSSVSGCRWMNRGAMSWTTGVLCVFWLRLIFCWTTKRVPSSSCRTI